MTNKEKNELQKEILKSLPSKPHGRLLLAPRSGKTKLIIDLIKREKPSSILWVTPTSKLAEEDIPLEFKKWNANKYLKNLTTTTWKSLANAEGFYEMIIFDEEQFATEVNLSQILEGELRADYIISMTGTASKHQDKEELYKRLNLEVLYELSIQKAVDIGLLSNYEINLVSIDLSEVKDIKAGNSFITFMTSEKKQYEYLCKEVDKSSAAHYRFKVNRRMRFIQGSKSKYEVAEFLMKNLEGRKLFFVAQKKQAESLSPHFYHGTSKSTSLEKFVSGEISELTLVNKGGTGYTFEDIDHLVIVQSDSDKNGLTSQKISRTLLSQKNYKAKIWILCLNQTQDVAWVSSTLENFDKEKIKLINFKELKEMYGKEN